MIKNFGQKPSVNSPISVKVYNGRLLVIQKNKDDIIHISNISILERETIEH